jgi:LysR family transcriptional regulator, regulator for metE and metH
MDLEVRHLRLVVAVAEHGTLTAAAEHLHLTQSALSHQLKDIEDRLQAPLFLRRNRRMTPTAAGQRLLETGQSMLAELEQTESAVRDLGGAKQGLLRVATECYTCYHWLPSVLQEFTTRCPGVDVRIDADATSRPLAVLLAGKLDLALMLSSVRDRRLAATPLFRDELVVVVPPHHRFASQAYVRPSQLADESMFIYSARENSYVFQRLLSPAGIVPRRLQQVQLTEAILELVRAGLGVSVLARWAVQPYLDRRAVVGVRLTPRGFYRNWTAVVPRALAATPYVAEFLRLVAAHVPVERKDVTRRPVLRAVRSSA